MKTVLACIFLYALCNAVFAICYGVWFCIENRLDLIRWIHGEKDEDA